MKKLLFICALVILFSCEKEPEHCWKCYKDINYNQADSWSSQEFFICGQSRSENEAFIIKNTYTVGADKHSMRCSEIDDNSTLPQ